MNQVERKLAQLDEKIDLIIELTEKHQTYQRPKNDIESLSSDGSLDKHVSGAPLSVIKKLDAKLFQRADRYDPLNKACEEFLAFYFENETLCLQLAKSFLEIAHFWILPGGIKEIERSYVLEHPFITCVYVGLAMCFDENYTYIEEQRQLYMLTTKLLGVAMITEPLTDHDVEAILYLSMYNIARKPKQPQIDNWLLSGIGIKHVMLSFNFEAICNRIYRQNYTADDLFHLRIWNAICACHFQYAFGSGRPVMITRDYYNVHSLTLKFPKATVGDAIKVAELDLDLIVLKMFESTVEFEIEKETLVFPQVEVWRSKWSMLIPKDVSGILSLAYDFFHIMLAKNILETHSVEGVHKTINQSSFKILSRFLRLPANLIRGSSSFTLSQIVFACWSLCDNLSQMTDSERTASLGLVTKIYWHLNQIGEKLNDATDTVGKIIKAIADQAQNFIPAPVGDIVIHNSPANSETSLSVKNNLYTGDLHNLLPDFTSPLDIFTKGGLHSKQSPDSGPATGPGAVIPDVAEFDTFEDFFRGVFSEVRGA